MEMLQTAVREYPPETALFLAVLQTFADDIRLYANFPGPKRQKKIKLALEEAAAPWAGEICDLVEIEQSWFLKELRGLAFRAGYIEGIRCDSIK